MHTLQICIGPTIRIGRESWCLPYAGFLYSLLRLGLVVRLLFPECVRLLVIVLLGLCLLVCLRWLVLFGPLGWVWWVLGRD